MDQKPMFNIMATANQCTADNLAATNPWPANLPGMICKSAPLGVHASHRLSQCCSGKVYNITTPTTPDSLAYPIYCGLVCQINPSMLEPNDANPFGYSDMWKCLIDAGYDLGGGQVQCSENKIKGVPMPKFTSKPTGDWVSKSWAPDYNDPGLIPPLTSISHYPASSVATDAPTTQSTAPASATSKASESTPSSKPATSAPTSAQTTAAPTPTSSTPSSALTLRPNYKESLAVVALVLINWIL